MSYVTPHILNVLNRITPSTSGPSPVEESVVTGRTDVNGDGGDRRNSGGGTRFGSDEDTHHGTQGVSGTTGAGGPLIRSCLS